MKITFIYTIFNVGKWLLKFFGLHKWQYFFLAWEYIFLNFGFIPI